MAVRSNYLDIVSLLLKRGDIDLNTCSMNGSTPLILAASKGFVEIVSALTLNMPQRNIDINARDSKGWSALSIAAKRNDVRMLSVLLDCEGIDVNQKCKVF